MTDYIIMTLTLMTVPNKTRFTKQNICVYPSLASWMTLVNLLVSSSKFFYTTISERVQYKHTLLSILLYREIYTYNCLVKWQDVTCFEVLRKREIQQLLSYNLYLRILLGKSKAVLSYSPYLSRHFQLMTNVGYVYPMLQFSNV